MTTVYETKMTIVDDGHNIRIGIPMAIVTLFNLKAGQKVLFKARVISNKKDIVIQPIWWRKNKEKK